MSALTPFGFSALESDIYLHLVKNPGATGYRVAQALRKPAANVYKALQTLADKGAVLLEDGAEPRRAAPVPPTELIRRLERDMGETLQRVRDEIADATPAPPGAVLLRLTSAKAVKEKTLSLVENARESVIGSLSETLRVPVEIESAVVPRLVVGPLLLVVDRSRAIVADGGHGGYTTSDPSLVAALYDAALVRLARDAAVGGAGGKKLARLIEVEAAPGVEKGSDA